MGQCQRLIVVNMNFLCSILYIFARLNINTGLYLNALHRNYFDPIGHWSCAQYSACFYSVFVKIQLYTIPQVSPLC